jgi:hypothetical protein
MKTCAGVDVQTYDALTSALVAGVWPASRPLALPPPPPLEKCFWYPLDTRFGGPQSQSGQHGEVKILDSTGTQTPYP